MNVRGRCNNQPQRGVGSIIRMGEDYDDDDGNSDDEYGTEIQYWVKRVEGAAIGGGGMRGDEGVAAGVANSSWAKPIQSGLDQQSELIQSAPESLGLTCISSQQDCRRHRFPFQCFTEQLDPEAGPDRMDPCVLRTHCQKRKFVGSGMLQPQNQF